MDMRLMSLGGCEELSYVPNKVVGNGHKLLQACPVLARTRGCRFDPPSSSGEGESGPQRNAVFFVLDRSLFETSTYNVLRTAVMWGRLDFAEKNALR